MKNWHTKVVPGTALTLLFATLLLAVGSQAPAQVRNFPTGIVKSDGKQWLAATPGTDYPGFSSNTWTGSQTWTANNVFGRSLTGAVNSDTLQDLSTINATVDSSAYASYDDSASVTGSTNYNHIAGFQYRPNYSGSGSISEMRGFWSLPTNSGAGTVTNLKHVYINDAGGTGPVTNQFGIFFNPMTRGSVNYTIYSADQVSPSFFCAPMQFAISNNQVGTNPTDGAIQIKGYGADGGSGAVMGWNTTSEYFYIQGQDYTHSLYGPIKLNMAGGKVYVGPDGLVIGSLNGLLTSSSGVVSTATAGLDYLPPLVRTAVKTANYTAAVSDLVVCDASAGSFSVTIPTAPATGSRLGLKLIALSGANTVTYAFGGSDTLNKTSGSTSGLLALLNQGATLQYDLPTHVWTLTSDDLPLGGLDARYSPLAGSSSVVTTGTIGAGVWQGTPIGGAYLASTGLTIAAYAGALTTDADASTVTFNLATTNDHLVVLGGNRTLALSNMPAHGKFTILVQQPASGGPWTVTWFSGMTIRWAGGAAPNLSTAAGKIDAFQFLILNSTTLLATSGLGF